MHRPHRTPRETRCHGSSGRRVIRHNARPLVLNAYLESFLCVKNTKPAARAKGSRLEDVGLGDELGDELAASLARPFLSADSQ